MGNGDGDKPENWSAKQEAAFQALEARRQPPAVAASPPAARAQTATGISDEPKSRRLPWIVRVGLVVVLGAGGAIANFFFASPELDAVETERQILSWAKDRDVAARRVDCPTGIEVEGGRTFNCILYTRSAGDLRVQVTIENDDGDLTWGLG